MPATTLGELIEQSLKGKRRNDVAKAIGVHRNALYQWTTGSRVPRLGHLRALALELGWSDSQLVEAMSFVDARPSAAA